MGTAGGERPDTGVPDQARGRREAFWHGFWDNKLRYLRSQGIYVYRGRVNPEKRVWT